MLNAFPFEGIEKAMNQKVEEAFLKYFGPSEKKDDKIRNLVALYIKNMMD